jgi:hypothetical protein
MRSQSRKTVLLQAGVQPGAVRPPNFRQTSGGRIGFRRLIKILKGLSAYRKTSKFPIEIS